jgi:hypothetical protein
MDRYISPTLFSAEFAATEGAATQPAYRLKTAKDLAFKEEWLQTAIQNDPRLVVDACTEGELTDESWWFWTKEFGTDAGSIDVLLVSETGRVAIVETKLSYNPEKRRSVLAQVLDYAVSLPRVESALPALPPECGVRMDQVEQRIQQGDFLLIVAGDQLDSRAVRLGRALLGDHLVNEWELALVEVAVFERVGSAEGPKHLLIPHLRGGIETELRQIVKVEVAQGDKNRVVVERAAPGESGGSVREKWTEDRFFAALDGGSLHPAYKAFGHGVRALREECPGTVLVWGTGRSGSVTVKRNGHGLVEFYLSGYLGFRTERPPLALGEAAGAAYVAGLRKLFPDQKNEYMWFLPANSEKCLPGLLDLLRTALKAADGGAG